VYAAPGTYTVKLVAKNGFNCSTLFTRTNYITILPPPAVSFSTPFSSSCDSTDTFQFSGQGGGIVSWQWAFGDGATAAGQTVSHVYNATGSFSVTLVATDAAGCTDTVTVTDYIHIGNSLTPGFSASPPAGCDSLLTSFTALVQNAVSWQWSFGDGGTSTLSGPTHLYAAPGSYTVTLAVTTSNGCNGSASYPNAVVVEPSPTAGFTVTQADPCDPYTFQFGNTSVQGATYLWKFGDGNTSAAVNPVHTYAAAGNYSVTLIAWSAGGCVDSLTVPNAVSAVNAAVNFTGTPRGGCAPLTVSFTALPYPNASAWSWDFGDGNTSAAQHPVHTYNALGEYKVRLRIATSTGCQDSAAKNKYIKVVSGNVAYTLPDTIIGCTPFSVSFANPLPGCDSAAWSFGNGDSSFAINASYVYSTPGIYTVSFFGSMPGGCSQTIHPFAIIKVDEFFPDSNLVLSASACQPFTFQFTNPSAGIVSYAWNFGDGGTDTAVSPVHTFAQAGTYTVSVTLTHQNGCVKTVSTVVTTGHPNPIVAGAALCAGDPVAFGVSNPALFVSYAWNFGDGSPGSALQNPAHAYALPGAYVVTLTATDTAGCTDTYASDSLHVGDVSAAFFTNDTTAGCDNLLVKFNDASTGALSWFWDFGDGDTAVTPNPTHYYANPGTYSVSLTVSDGTCTRTAVQPALITVHGARADFSYAASGPCYPVTVTCSDSSLLPVSWQWDFGDGGTSTLQNPVHVYTTQPAGIITLAVTDANGCTATKKRSYAAPPPVIAGAPAAAGCRPFTASFYDSTAQATAWLWDFGDGGTSVQRNPSHTYAAAGAYAVTVQVTVATGCTHGYPLPDSIRVSRPTAAFTAPQSTACAPALFQFTDQSAGAVAWHWDFGDGTTSTSASPNHIYSLPGDYTVTLAVLDSTGCTDTLVKKDFIQVKGTYAYFTLSAQASCMNTFVQFTDSSINATAWQWNFGDGHASNLQNPSHHYVDTGSYTVSLITTDSLGCTSFYTHPDPIVVHPAPAAAGAFASAHAGCQPLTVSFTDQSTGATAVHWLFGDGDSSAAGLHTYPQWGQYYASVVAVNAFGCTDTFTLPLPVEVLQTPRAGFLAAQPTGCTGHAFALTDTSTNVSGPAWWWQAGAATSTQQHPTIQLMQPGLYTVTLAVTNANGCSDTAVRPAFLEVLDTVPPAVTPLLGASVLNDTGVEIRWQASPEPDLKEYRLFRLGAAGAQYQLIATVPDTSNANLNVDLVYHDTGLNTLARSYTYKVQSVDLCDQARALALSVAHTTVNVSAQAAGEDVLVQWTPYGGCGVSGYEITRLETAAGAGQVIATVPGNVLAFTDTTADCPVVFAYRIRALDLCGRPYAAWSDTAAAVPASVLAVQQADIVRSTVVNNRDILTEWFPPAAAPHRVAFYRVLRSRDGGPFSHIATVPAGVHSYLDDQAEVDESVYRYRIEIFNDCNLTGADGLEGTSILLRSDWKNNKTTLQWSPYDRWPSGVDRYVIEKKNAQGVWITVTVVDGNATVTELNE
jgi:PKD repeat protein